MVAVVQVHRDERIARWNLRHRLRRAIRVRREKRAEAIKRRDAEILARANTLDTISNLPTTLGEALPSDPKERAKDERAIVVTECTGTFNMIGCNRAWENLCGYAEPEIVGKDSSILQGPETNHLGLHEAVQRLFEEEKPVRVVTTNYRKNGSKFKNLLTLGPIRDESGKVTHCVAVLRDITSRRW